MNNKAQAGYAFFTLIIFGILFFAGFASFLADYGQATVAQGNLVGFEAFFYGNIVLWVFFAWMLALIAVSSLAGGG